MPKNILKELWYDLAAARAIRNPQKLPYYAEELDAAGVRLARQMIAEVYVQKGVVNKAKLQADGTMLDEVDPYWRHSIYLGVRDKKDQRLIMAARLVLPKEKGGVEDLQIHLNDLPPRFRAKLKKLNPRYVAELAGYVKEQGLGPVASRMASLLLIRQLAAVSKELGIKMWVFGLRPELKRKYERIFGPAMERQGDYARLGKFNAQFLPYSIDIIKAAKSLNSGIRWPGGRQVAKFIFQETGSPKARLASANRSRAARLH